MPQLVEFPLESGDGEVWIEVQDRSSGGGLQPAGRGDGLVVRAKNTFDEALSTFRPAARAIIHALSDLAPDELEITLGIKFTADARAFIAATGTEATIGLKVTWKAETAAVKEK